MGVQKLTLAALAVLASGCLGAPPDARDVPPTDDDLLPDPFDAGEASADATPDVSSCADAFAVAYTSQLDVRTGGGVFDGVLVIQALGDGVDLTDMIDESDDSNRLELELIQSSDDPVPAGNVSGELHPDSAALIVGPLVDAETWTQPATPTFRLDFATRASEAPPPHHATALLRIGGSIAVLDFDLTYVPGQVGVAVPRAGSMVYSACGE
jgi:hypothetical protein